MEIVIVAYTHNSLESNQQSILLFARDTQ